MPQLLHNSKWVNWFRRIFTGGVNTDVRPEMLKDGLYSAAQNLRPANVDGETGALETIRGESELYPPPAATATFDPTAYVAIGSYYPNDQVVTFWASPNQNSPNLGDNPPTITINGDVAAQSPNIPYTFDRPLQAAVIENCGEGLGVIYPADHQSDPLYWDVKAMLDALSAGSQAFFAAYTQDQNSVAQQAPPTIPWPQYPDCLVDLGSNSVGLPVGQYAYSVRYVDPNGNRTNWSPETGLIPVPIRYTPNNVSPAKNYPRTYGADANANVGTQYGIVIEFRVDNLIGYSSLEIKRRAFNNGAGQQGLGVQEIIARLPLAPGQVNIVTFTDPVDTNINPPEVVPDDEAAIQSLSIRAPKAVDYSDKRLKYANFMLDPKDITLTFVQMAGRKMTAITKALRRAINNGYVPDGYDNPYNCAVNKSAQRGGQAKYGIQFWDGNYGLYPAVNIPEPFVSGTDIMYFPQRRDIKGDNVPLSQNYNWGRESLDYSDDPCYAANVDVASQTTIGPVSPTFEAFTSGTQTKQDTASLVNVAKKNDSNVPGSYVGRRQDQFNLYAFGNPPSVEVAGVSPVFVRPTDSQGYQPWRPVNDQDGSDSGFNIPPNTSRFTAPAGFGGSPDGGGPNPPGFLDQCFGFSPQNNLGACMNPTHQALGALLGGVDSGVPKNATIMSVVYNGDTQGEIVAQGFGSWNLQNTLTPNPSGSGLNDNDFQLYRPATKTTNSLRCFFPDQAKNLVDPALWQDIQQNPSQYKLRFVSPLPFYPEVYGYSGERFTEPGLWCGLGTASHIMDIMCHTSFLHDEGSVPGGVNVGVDPVSGYQPIPGSAPDGSWVGFDKWRRSAPMQGYGGSPPADAPDYSFWQQMAQGGMEGQGGNTLFDMTSLQQATTGRTTYYNLQTAQYIYTTGGNDVIDEFGAWRTGVNEEEVKNFQQPWYVLNIIRVGATIPESNIEPYKNMGCHIAMKTNIGIYQGGIQDFRLIGEREKYDCTNYFPTDFRYTYVRDITAGEQRYLCVTGNTQIILATVLADIAANGFWVAPDGGNVYGVYESLLDGQGNTLLRFGTYTSPAVGSSILVRYDKTAPIRVFGHDLTVAPVTHAVRDAYLERNDVSTAVMANTDVLAGLPFIHAGFGLNPRWFMPEKTSTTEEQIWINMTGEIRQWCIMWSCESRALPSMYTNVDSEPGILRDDQQYFPAIHYVARPTKDVLLDVPPSAFFSQYQTDYPDEWDIFGYGGLRYQPGINYDYTRQPDVGFFGYPRVGITYPNDYCTAIAASNEFDPTLSDLPGLRTFLAQNMTVLSDEAGEIKVIATATYPGGSGQNQYVWFQEAVGRVLTNKNILTGASGEQVSTYVTSNYWGTELRISRTVGLPDQFWRLWSRGYAPSGNGYADTFYWPDRNGWYQMRADDINDISRNKLLKDLTPYLKNLPSGYSPQVTAFYNAKYQEMWASIKGFNSGVNYPASLFVYSGQTGEWLGRYTYLFDNFLNTKDRVLAMRTLSTWNLDTGYTISGVTRESFATVPIVGDLGKFKEAVRWRVVGDKPDGMQIYDKDGVLMSDQSEAIQEAFEAGTGFLWTKLYDSYEGQWWRVMISYDPERKRAQDVRFFVKVIFNTAEDKSIVALENQLKNIR